MLRLPNLLASRRGRLAAFFFLYVTEGIPLGFAATAIATQLRREGVGPAAIGAFVGSLYLPWAFKWALGPVVDVFSIERLGRRRGWILLTQLLMVLTLLSTMALRLPEQLALFTVIVFAHNVVGATQDVAIDALACGTLHEDERGAANGLMFAGAYLGQMVGGAGVLFLTGYTGFQATFVFVAACILAVTAFVVLPMREPPGPPRPDVPGPRWRSALGEVRDFAALSFRSVLGTRPAFAGLFVALLPAGALSLSLALQSNLAVELGLNDDQVATLNLCSTIIAALFCVFGGFLSDRVGRRRLYGLSVILAGVPALLLMWALLKIHWIMPIPPDAPDRPIVPAWAITIFWTSVLSYSAVAGTMYGVRSAMYMDVTNPAVAATQFTAYMALLNVTISYTATWQGIAIEAWGYPRTILIDVIAGVLCLALVPFMRKVPASAAGHADARAPRRARALALGLAVPLLLWVPFWLGRDFTGAAKPIVQTFFTLAFVIAAVFLAAGGAVLRGGGTPSGVLPRVGLWMAPLLLLMYARHYAATLAWWAVGGPAAWVVLRVLEAVFLVVPPLAACVLILLASRSWSEMRDEPAVSRA